MRGLNCLRLGVALWLLATTAAFPQAISGSSGLATPGAPGSAPGMSPGYVANNWYVPINYTAGVAGTPAVSGGNRIACNFGVIPYPVTLSSIGILSTTTDSAKRVQLAIYTSGAWGRPAALVANTADIAMGASAGALNGALAVSLAAGGYWFCLNTESTVAVFTSISNGAAAIPTAGVIGASTQALIGPTANTMVMGASIAQTYGTWPAFNSGTSWTEITANFSPFIVWRVASSP